MKKQTKRFLFFHIAAAICIPLFFLYRRIFDLLPRQFVGCFLHDYLLIYCPLCGGTRAVDSLLHFRLVQALKENAFVVLAALIAFYFYIIAWIKCCKKQTPLVKIPNWLWIVLAGVLVIFFIGRNLLLIRFGFDPLGDLLPFWHAEYQ